MAEIDFTIGDTLVIFGLIVLLISMLFFMIQVSGKTTYHTTSPLK